MLQINKIPLYLFFCIVYFLEITTHDIDFTKFLFLEDLETVKLLGIYLVFFQLFSIPVFSGL